MPHVLVIKMSSTQQNQFQRWRHGERNLNPFHQRGYLDLVLLLMIGPNVFCKKQTYKKNKCMINASLLEVAETIRRSAEAKGDHHMLRILLGVNNDLVAAEAKYHKICHASYISKSNLKSQAFKEDEGKESLYDQVFLEMVASINGLLKSGRAYDMSSLLKKYVELLEERGVDAKAYSKQNLKLRIKSYYGEEIVFHQPYNKSSPELLYSSSISLKDVINASAI